MSRSRRPAARAAIRLLAVVPLLASCGSSSPAVLDVGDCLAGEALQDAQTAPVEPLDCDRPHDAEVYATLEFDEEEYPGSSTLVHRTVEFCGQEFEDYVGIAYAESDLEVVSMYPPQDSWSDARQRRAHCVLIAPEPVTGSLAGAAR